MSRSAVVARLLAVGLVLLVLGGVVPVATAQAPEDCPGAGTSSPTGNIDDPDEGQVVSTSSTVVRGCYEYGSDTLGPLGTITKVTVSLVAGRGQVLPGGSTAEVFNGPPTRAYKLSWTTPNLTWNGPYTVKVVVNGNPRPPAGPQTVEGQRQFLIEAPPAAPKGLKAEPQGEEGVTVSWDKNKEPDIVGYEVHRAPKDGDFAAIALTAANLTTLNDRPSVGEWRYVVIAIRRGAGDDGIASGPSAVADATVVTPPSPAPSTTAAGGGGGGGGSGGGGGGTAPPTTLQKTGSGIVITSASTGAGGAAKPSGGRGSKVDLSGFSSLGRPTTRQTEAPDPGFDETLPFDPADEPAVASEDDTEELGADDPNNQQAVGQDLISDDSNRRRSLTFVAFGLLLFVMSMGGLWVRGEVKRADELEALDPEPQRPGQGGAGPGPSPPAPGPPPGPAPRSLTASVAGDGGGTQVFAPPPVVATPLPARAVAAPPPAPPSRPPSPATATPAPVPPPREGHAQRARDRAARRAARGGEGSADPLAGMAPLSPPPPRPWSARQPLDAPALDVPDPDQDVTEEPAGAARPRRSRRSAGERRLPVR